MKSGRRHLIQILLNLHLLMKFVRHPYSTFISEILHCNENLNAMICALILYFLKPIIPLSSPSRRPEPIIPLFHHSIIPIGAKPLTMNLGRKFLGQFDGSVGGFSKAIRADFIRPGLGNGSAAHNHLEFVALALSFERLKDIFLSHEGRGEKG